MSTKIDAETVKSYLLGLQDRICAALEHEDGQGRFSEDRWQRPEGGGGRSRVLTEGVYSSREGSISPMSSGRTCLPVKRLELSTTKAQRR